MTDTADAMREMRENWRELGFSLVTVYVRDKGIERFKAAQQKRLGEELLEVLEERDRDDAMRLVDKRIRGVPDYVSVAEMKRRLADATDKVRKRFDEFEEMYHNYQVIAKRVESWDYETRDELLFKQAERYATGLVLAGEWYLLQEWYADV